MMQELGFIILLWTTTWTTGQSFPTIESLHLTGHLGYQTIRMNGFLTGHDGKMYSLSEVEPYDELLAPTRFHRLQGGSDGSQSTFWDLRSGAIFEMPIFRAIFDDGKTIVQVQRRNEDGSIVYGEIRSSVGGVPTTYFVKTAQCKDNELLVFREDQMDESFLEENNNFDHEEIPIGHGLRHQRQMAAKSASQLPDFVYERGDGSSSDCAYFKVVKIGIVYDSEFCLRFGGESGASSRIMMIVAAASVFFENDMCVKLQITDIYTPDPGCASPSTFASFRRDRACGDGNSETFIRYFRDWMDENRDDIGLDPEATIHGFTGVPHRGTLGCAYIGTVCRIPDYAYGVDYMNTNSLSVQSIILAHELGHNLSARHLTAEQSLGFRYIMNRSLNTASDGFSENTVGTILEFLDSNEVTCDTVEFPRPSSAPTSGPTKEPSDTPSLQPSSNPSLSPSFRPTGQPSSNPSPTPSFLPSVRPSFAPSVQPSMTPSKAPTSAPVECTLQPESNQPRCILGGDDSLFQCYNATELMRVIPGPGCSENYLQNATIEFVSCEEDSGDDDIPSNDDLSNDSDRRGLRTRTPDNVNESAARNNGDSTRVLASSISAVTLPENDVELEHFESSNCEIGCILTGDYICVDSSLKIYESERSYVLAYSLSHGDGQISFHSVETTVRRNVGLDHCDIAQTVCIDPLD